MYGARIAEAVEAKLEPTQKVALEMYFDLKKLVTSMVFVLTFLSWPRYVFDDFDITEIDVGDL